MRPARKRLVLWWAAAMLALAAGRGLCGETAAFLKLSPSARSAAMADAFTAAGDDADAALWNPAGIGALDRFAFSATHSRMFADQGYDSLALAVPLELERTRERTYYGLSNQPHATARHEYSDSLGMLGLAAKRLSHAPQEGRDTERRPAGTVQASDMAFTLAYARPVGPGLLAGASVTRIESRLAEAKAAAWAAGAGALLALGERWNVGVSVRNLGRGLQYGRERSALPAAAAVGLAARAGGTLLISGEWTYHPNDRRSSMGAGAECWLGQTIALRAGYLLRDSAAGRGWTASAGLPVGGLGISWRKFRMDYAVASQGDLGRSQRVSLAGQLGW